MTPTTEKPGLSPGGRRAVLKTTEGSWLRLLTGSLSLVPRRGVAVLLVAIALAATSSGDVLEGVPGGVGTSRAQESGEEPEEPTPVSTPVEEEVPAVPPVEAGEEGAEPGGGGDGGLPPWAWVVLGAGLGAGLLLAIVGVIAWSQQDRPTPALVQESKWRRRALDVYARAAAIHDTVIADLGGGLPSGGAVEALKQRRRDVERRMNDLAADLHALEVKPPDPASADAVRDMLATLGALRSAMQSDLHIRTQEEPATPTDAQLEESAAAVRGRLADFDGSVRAFRSVI